MNGQPNKARIWVDSIGPGTCKSCGQKITWVEFCKSGKKAPFDELVVANAGRDEETGREFQTVHLEKAHWATCPDAASHRRSREAPRTVTGLGQIAGAIAELREAQASLRLAYRENERRDNIERAGVAITRALSILST